MECKKAIYHVVGMESRNEALPIQLSGTRGKGPKRLVYPVVWYWRERINKVSISSYLGLEGKNRKG